MLYIYICMYIYYICMYVCIDKHKHMTYISVINNPHSCTMLYINRHM